MCSVEKDGPLPNAAVWEEYSGYGRAQAGGLCTLFADMGAIEVQYAINNCERLSPRPASCPARPEDDDAGPGLGAVVERTETIGGVDVHRGWDLDLSEHLVIACAKRGYDYVGAGSDWASHGPWMATIGTVVEELVPLRLEYGAWGPVTHDPVFWWPPPLAAPSDVDPFYGTCPLVHRYGDGHGDAPFPNRGCEIAEIADAFYGTADPRRLPTFFRVEADPLYPDAAGWDAVLPEDLLGYLAAGYVVSDNVLSAWSDTPDPGRVACNLRACPEGVDCSDHTVLVLGYEDGGRTLVFRNSWGERGPLRMARGTCGLGVGGLARIAGPIRSLDSDCSDVAGSRGRDPVLHAWLVEGDEDLDDIPNGLDVCLYTPNPMLVSAPGTLEEPSFDRDVDAWPDEPLDFSGDWGDPQTRFGCDNCPSLPSADRFQGEWDADPWGKDCDGCPFTDQWTLDEHLALMPTDDNDPDGDGLVLICDACPGVSQWEVLYNLDGDGDGLGMACDPCTEWWNLDPADPLYRPRVFDLRCALSEDPDVDGDGVINSCDNCCIEPNVLQQDGSGDFGGLPDGIGDACELCPGIPDIYGGWPDDDGDRLGDWCGSGRPVVDTCVGLYNPEDRDDDGDGRGNACDGCDTDATRWSSVDFDSDGDGEADDCDSCPYGELALGEAGRLDPDRDGWATACDSCPNDANPGQQNCDWRWEHQYSGMPGFELEGDACDDEPCTGVSPVAADLHLNPAASPPSPEAYLGMPLPVVPEPTPNFRVQALLGDFVTETVGGETMTVDVPTTGYRTMRLCWGLSCWETNYAESLPVGVRRCVCWDWRHGVSASDAASCRTRSPEVDICPDDGDSNWKVPEGVPGSDGVSRNDLSGWLAAKLPGGLNYPDVTGAIETDAAWRDREAFLAQDPDLTTPPATDRQYASQDGTWFARRAGYEAGEGYPGWQTTWSWQDEAAPEDLTASGFSGPVPFVLWTRPEIAAPPADDPGGGTRLTNGAAASATWRLVAKTDARCLLPETDSNHVDCDDYGNAYSAEMIFPAVTTDVLDGGERPRSPGSRWSPFGDFGDPAGAPGLGTLPEVVLPVIRIVNPPDPPGLKFSNYAAAAATQGLAINWVTLGNGYANHTGFASQMAAGEPAIDVSEFSMAFEAPESLRKAASAGATVGVAPVASGRFYLFGGVDPDGHFSNRLWIAEAAAGGADDPPAFRWRRAGASGTQPPGLVGAGLLVHLAGKPGVIRPPYSWDTVENDLLVVGGFAASGGLNSNLWHYDTTYDVWYSLGPPPGETYHGAWMGITWRGAVGYLYGGWDGTAALDGLWALDMRTRHLARLDSPGLGGPGPRAQATIAVTGDGSAVVLHGGVAASGWTNDVWRFDLHRRLWEQVSPPCTTGQCPLPGRATLAVESRTGRMMLVPMEADAQNEPYWLGDVSGWTSADGLIGSPAVDDCDGDGTPEPYAGLVCRAAAEWWAPVGTAECDSMTAGVACDAEPPVEPRATEMLRGFRDPRFAVTPGGMAYLLAGRRVVPVDLSNPARPRRHPPVHLRAEGREVALHGGTLYAATAAGLEAYDLATPSAPARLWAWPMAGGVDDLASWGDRLALAEPDGFRILDVSNRKAPLEIAAHRLVRVIPGAWVVDPSGCERDLIRWLLPGRRIVQYDGRTLVFGDRFDLIALDVGRDGVVERLYRPIVLPGRVREMKLFERVVYTDTIGWYGFVVRVGDGDLSVEGIHALDGWADGAVFTATAAFRATPRGLEVAYVP